MMALMEELSAREQTAALALLNSSYPGNGTAEALLLDDAVRGANEGSKPVHEPVQMNRNEPVHEPAFEQEVVSEAFKQFWFEYPRKVGKQDCLRIYRKLKPKQELQDRILRALREQKLSEQWSKDNGQFIPLPKTWLNRGSWDDEPVQIEKCTQVQVQVQKAVHQCYECDSTETNWTPGGEHERFGWFCQEHRRKK